MSITMGNAATKEDTEPTNRAPRSTPEDKYFGNAKEPSDEDIVYYKKLGLGRGLDVAKPSPWLSKSSFQVRDFTKDDIMETLEGGSLQHYDREITSDHQQRSEIRCTVKPTNAPVAIGVDAEQSRSYSYSQHAVGTKIINRTISFRVSFEDAPRSRVEKTSAGQAPDSEQALKGFEEKFSEWLLERITLHREESPPESVWHKVSEPSNTASNKEKVAAFIKGIKNHDHRKELVKELQKDCGDFVSHFGITHYVSAIELGAAAYQVMSEKEFSARVAGRGRMGVESIVGAGATASVSQEFMWRKRKSSMEQKKIGKITTEDGEKRVMKDAENEAVVGIQIRPISSLVRSYYLEEALRAALIEYTTKEERLAGPFLIACGPATPCSTAANLGSTTANPGSTAANPGSTTANPGSTAAKPGSTAANPGSTAPETSTLYIHIKSDHKLGVTKNYSEATKFSIVPIEGSHPHEFMIMSTSDLMNPLPKQPPLDPKERLKFEEEEAKREKIPYYLEAKCNIRGKQSRDLKMRTSIKARNARMALQKSVVDDDRKVPVDITRWLQGKESYFIRCARRVHSKGGYLCVKQPQEGPFWGREKSENYEVEVVPSINEHNDAENSFMLFRLLPQGLIPGLADGYIRTDGESGLSHAQ